MQSCAVHEPGTSWLLTGEERGNRATGVHSGQGGSPAWSVGNLVRPLVHGASYFAALHAELTALRAGDRVWFTDWRGDPDERLLPGGPSIGELLCSLAESGVEVRGLVWRSHEDRASSPISGRPNQMLGREINDAGGEVLLDQRVRRFGSHHQKLFVLRHRSEPTRDVAFVGGIDLCHSRRDDADHRGDPQAVSMDPRYGPTPPWHDVTLELRGPVVADVLAVFAERWDDPTPLDRRTPYRMLQQRLARMPRHPKPLPETAPPPPPAGPHTVQLLRTYAPKRPRFPFAPFGERSVARAYGKAFSRARSLIYIEDQYLWSTEVATGIALALRRNPDLRVIAVVPRFPDSDGTLAGPPSRLGQIRALRLLQRTAPDRVGVFDLENEAGTPIYVHAKVCVVDDIWATCGSDNFNRRSWTTDSELSCAVVDTIPADASAVGDDPRRFAVDLRLRLWSEHLGLDANDLRGLDPAAALSMWREAAAELDGWHRGGERAPRPHTRIRTHTPEPITAFQRLWATPLYRFVLDPDSRPRRLRGTARF